MSTTRTKKIKTAAATKHFKNRLKERFGIELSYSEIWQLTKTIKKSKNVLFVDNGFDKREKYLAVIQDKTVLCVFDRSLNTVVTCY